MLLRLCCVVLFIIQLQLPLSVAVDCQFGAYDESGTYVNYDLRPLVSPTTYIFRAKIGSYHYRYQGQQYDYLINVCDDVHPDAQHPACNELAHAPAYQVTAPPQPVVASKTSGKYTPPPPPPYEAACFRIADSGNVAFEFMNSSNPDEGVKVLYRGGQRCRKRNTPEVIKETNETWRDVDREVQIELICDREMGATDGATMTDLINSGATINVEEKSPPDECQYVIRWRTQHACPYGGGYAKVSQGSLPTSGGTWFGWFVKMCGYGFCIFLVVVMVVILPVVRKRISQYQRGDFLGFGDFLSYLIGDVQVRLAQLLSSGGHSTSLPTRGHMHEI